MSRNLSVSQSVYVAVRRDIMACMETGNFDRALTVLNEYKSTVQESNTLEDLSEDLRTEIVQAYGVSL